MDASDDKRHVVEKLEAIGAGFIDVGMGLELVDGSLGGILRVVRDLERHNARLGCGGRCLDAHGCRGHTGLLVR